MRRAEGDGRRLIHPDMRFVLPGTRPISVTRSQARMFCEHFEQSGNSSHSGQGGVLWVILEHCADMNLRPHIVGRAGYGFYVSIKRRKK